MGSLENLNKSELASLGESSGVSLDPDNQSKSEMIAALNDAGVTDAPSQEEAEEAAEEKEADLRDRTNRYAGGTAGGASESQQPVSKQSGLPGAGTAEVPEYDPETALGINPRPAVPRSPSLDYDDDAAGKPGDAG